MGKGCGLGVVGRWFGYGCCGHSVGVYSQGKSWVEMRFGRAGLSMGSVCCWGCEARFCNVGEGFGMYNVTSLFYEEFVRFTW